MSTRAGTSSLDDNTTIIQGWLAKRSRKTHQWRKRWVVLRNCHLAYYKESSEHKPCKVIPRESVLAYSVVSDHQQFHFAIYTGRKVLHWRAETKEAFEQWLEALARYVEETSEVSDAGESGGVSDEGTHEGSGAIEEDLSDEMSDSPNFGEPNNECEEIAGFSRLRVDDEYVVEHGYVWRLRKRTHQWRRVYVELTNRKINVSKSRLSSAPYKQISVGDIVDVIEIDQLSSTKVWCLMIILPSSRIRLCANSEDDLTSWLSAIKSLARLNHQGNRE